MVQALKEIQAAKTIENVEDLSEYGLEDAVCSITVQGEKEYQLAIGEETGLGGQRYLSIGDGNVYLVDASLLDTFALGLYDIVEKETIPSMTDLRLGTDHHQRRHAGDGIPGGQRPGIQ